MNDTTYSAYVALIGRPNVGKSTLLNRVLGEKISITSHKPQTTRHRILGVKTDENRQIIFVDTPGIHKDSKRALNKVMNQAAMFSVEDSDIVIFMVDATQWREEDELVLNMLQKTKRKVILAVNKVDMVKEKDELLPLLEKLSERMSFDAVFPLSAKNGDNIDALENYLFESLPEGPLYFPKEQVTDRDDRFMLAEIVREKLFRGTNQELPYSTTVTIEKFALQKGIYHISALIVVEREGQKKIVIGKNGENLKKMATSARLDIEKKLDCKVFLKVWVKVKSGWADDKTELENLGISE